MSEIAAAAGWRPDPWGQGELRWHDGADWTGHVHGPAPVAVEEAEVEAAADQPRITPEAALLIATAGMPRTVHRESNGAATAALITGLMGVPILPSLLGGLALYRSAEDSSLGGRGAAIAGIVLGVVNVLLLVALMSTLGGTPAAPVDQQAGIAPFTEPAVAPDRPATVPSR